MATGTTKLVTNNYAVRTTLTATTPKVWEGLKLHASQALAEAS